MLSKEFPRNNSIFFITANGISRVEQLYNRSQGHQIHPGPSFRFCFVFLLFNRNLRESRSDSVQVITKEFNEFI